MRRRTWHEVAKEHDVSVRYIEDVQKLLTDLASLEDSMMRRYSRCTERERALSIDTLWMLERVEMENNYQRRE